MTDLNKNIENFKTKGYCVIKDSISQDIRDIITQYALFDEMQNFFPEKNKGKFMVPNAHSIYGDPAMESMLVYLCNIVEKNTGMTLHPTYSYYRIYRNGDELKKHKDRPACEISVTLCFNYDYNNKTFSWPIYVEDEKISQNPGDILIYKGCELAHYRKKLEINDENAWHVQGFFHYVNAHGLNAEWKYDKRESVGIIERGPTTTNFNKSYIEFTK